MASRLTSKHQANQSTIVDALLQAIAHIWHALNVQDLKQSLPVYQAAYAALVRRYGMASGAVAAKHYRAVRSEAGLTDMFTPRVAKPPPFEQIQKETAWATKDLWSEQPDIEVAQKNLEGVASKLVQGVGRDTIINSVNADRKARAWARIAEPNACAFCMMLVSRGAVYKTQQSASHVVDHRGTRAEGEAYHDHCRCHVEPVFGEYTPSAQEREMHSLWDSTGSLNAFRKALGHN